MKKKNDIHPANPRFPDPEPIPRTKKKKQKNSKQASIALASDHRLPVPATVVVVICEPRGLSNPITMGIKTSKSLMGMEWISGEVAASD